MFLIIEEELSHKKKKKDKIMPFAASRGLPGGSVVKNPPAKAGDSGSIPGQDDPLEKETQPLPVSLPGKIHGQRSLAGYCP